MAIVALLDPDAPIPLQVDWALWLARSRRATLTLLAPREPESAAGRVRVQVATRIGDADDYELREDSKGETDGEGEADGSQGERGDAGADERDERPFCKVVAADVDDPEQVQQLVGKAVADVLLVLAGSVEAKQERLDRLGESVLPRISCSVALVDLGDQRWPVRHLMVAGGGRGGHARAALREARALAAVAEGSLTVALVQSDVGDDSRSVGRMRLDRLVRETFPDDDGAAVASGVRRHVEIGAGVEAGLADAERAVQPDALVFGLPRPGLLGARFYGTKPARVSKRSELPVLMLRRALPFGNRLRRRFEELLQQVVPQAERSSRVLLASRVQGSSVWNFDFVALTSLSTVIAALGLLQDSAAVIIGAMLIAPLMTPILGVALALVQGNTRLLRRASSTILLGVATSFVLAALVGWMGDASGDLRETTAEMVARGWPGLIDLFVAFASGLAAAYAHSRPGLVAALPGVAIAAALVPPIATSGLAFSAGDLTLTYGALLLFVTNMVAIVLAAGLSLWAVGLRKQRDSWLRHVGSGLVVVVLALTVHLTQRVHLGGRVLLPRTLREELATRLRERLGDAHSIVSLEAEQRMGHVLVTVTVGGPEPPPALVAGGLAEAVAAAVDGAVELRMRHVFEVRTSADAPR